MDRFKRTPGPWAKETDSINSILIVDSDQVEVCGIIATNDEDLLTEREWHNASLIAAAPDLLKALIKVRDLIDGVFLVESSDKECISEAITAADAAINKARGI
jgi:hypothetical protein